MKALKTFNELFFGESEITNFDIVVYTAGLTVILSMIYVRFF